MFQQFNTNSKLSFVKFFFIQTFEDTVKTSQSKLYLFFFYLSEKDLTPLQAKDHAIQFPSYTELTELTKRRKVPERYRKQESSYH